MNYVKPTHETTWPAIDQSLSELEWRLRYGDAQLDPQSQAAKDRMAAASVLAAYRELVTMTEANRRPVIRALRRACKAAD